MWLIRDDRMSSIFSFPTLPYRPARGVSTHLGLALALVALLGMAAWSWGRLVEIQVDFGREVYLAWQIASGKRLYADLVYYHGPLSLSLNALVFRWLGVSLRTLMVFNLVIASLITISLYMLFRDVAGALAATTACMVFTLTFACSKYSQFSIFNYMCPYNHASTHGLLLGLVSILLAGRVNRVPMIRNAFCCGLAIGLVFLTKPELFVAAGGAVLVGLGLTARLHRLTRRGAAVLLAAWICGVVLVALVAFLTLRLRMSSHAALVGVLGSWPYIRNQADTLFYQWIMGSDDIGGNLRAMLRVLLWYGAMLMPLALYVPSRKRRIILFALGGGSLAAALACIWPDPLNPFEGLLPLPIFLGIVAIALSWRLVQSRDAAQTQALTRKLMLTVFAGLLLGRIFLKASVLNYGFVLAVPGTMILIVAWLDWLPVWVGAPANRLVHTGMVLCVVILWVLVSLTLSRAAYQERRFPVGSGSDRFLGDRRCQWVVPLLEEIRHRVRPGETLCVLPEGIMINYLTRIESSVPFDCFLPAVLQMFDERKIVATFRAHPPDYVLLFHRVTPEYGVALFGRDYGRELSSWVMERYCPVAVYGHDPMSEDGDGLILMAPRSAQEGGSTQSMDKEAG
jgi:hypothetical protein